MYSPFDDHLALLFSSSASLCNMRGRRDASPGGLIDTGRQQDAVSPSSPVHTDTYSHSRSFSRLIFPLPQRSRDEHRNHHQHHDHDHAFPFHIHCMIAFISFHFPDSLRFLLLFSLSAGRVSFLEAQLPVGATASLQTGLQADSRQRERESGAVNIRRAERCSALFVTRHYVLCCSSLAHSSLVAWRNARLRPSREHGMQHLRIHGVRGKGKAGWHQQIPLTRSAHRVSHPRIVCHGEKTEGPAAVTPGYRSRIKNASCYLLPGYSGSSTCPAAL